MKKNTKKPQFPCSPLSQELVNWPRSARAVFFDLTGRLETRQQTLVLLLSYCCCPFHVVASRILRSLEFDG